MNSSGDETFSGASTAKNLVQPMLQIDFESDNDGEHVGTKKRTLRKDTRPWESVAMLEKDEGAVHDAEQIKQMIY